MVHSKNLLIGGWVWFNINYPQFLKSAKKFRQNINTPKYPIRKVTISWRVLNHWHNKGILDDNRTNKTGWKKLNTINLSIKFPITLSVNSKNFDLIQDLEKKLYDLDLVSNYYIDSFSNEKTFYKVIYNGTPDKFINEFINSNINLNTNNPIWSLEWKI